MSWGDIDLSTAPADNEQLPVSEALNFVVTGAKPNKFDVDKVDVFAKVFDGEYRGRKTIFSYPDPAKQDWSTGIFVRLAKSMGIPINKGESPVEYIQRAATEGGKFTAPVKSRTVEVDGLEVDKHEIQIFKVKSYRG